MAIIVERRRLTWMERTYLPQIVSGLWITLKNLFKQGLCPRYRIFVHYKYIFHILIPFFYHRTFTLYTGGIFSPFFAFVVTEKHIPCVPDSVVFYSGFRKHLLHFRPYFIVPFYIFCFFSRHNSSGPCVFFHIILLAYIFPLKITVCRQIYYSFVFSSSLPK